MLQLVDSLAAQFPFTDASTVDAPPAVKVESAIKPQDVTDATAFKAQLNASKAAVPARSFEELAKDPSQEGEQLANVVEAVLRKTGAAALEDGEPKANL